MTCEEKVCEQVVINMKCCGGGEATADITIGENGNWFINGEDTGVQAQGPAGEKGDVGPVGPAGVAGSFANAELLFSGEVKENNHSITLAKSIDNYSCLIIVIGSRILYMDNRAHEDHILNLFPKVTQTKNTYGHHLRYELYQDELYTHYAGWHFPNKNEMIVDELYQGMPVPNNIEVFISKVYGLK